MASDSGSSSSLPSWQFMVLLAAALGAFLTNGHLASIRPASVEPEKDRGSLIDAHLSEDPFGAWVRADKKADSAEGPIPGVAGAALPNPLGAPDGLAPLVEGRRLCILPVIVRGDFHSTEAREMRIRFRTSTVAGLGAEGLVSDDPNHLLLLPPPPDWAKGTGRATTVADQPIPAEWFISGDLPRHHTSPYGAVLVVWIQDEALFINPLATLLSLKAHLTAQVAALKGAEAGALDFKVIGPYWSGTLSDIAVERNAALREGKANYGAGISFYSATATMADGVLDMVAEGDLKNKTDEGGDDAGPLGRRGLTHAQTGPLLVNLTCTDEDLAEALINELMLRGIRMDDEDTRIAIISDWDTEYGRVLPLTFAAKLRQIKALKDDYIPSLANTLPRLGAQRYAELKYDEDRHWPRQVLRAYYISGVGGSASTVGGSPASDDSGKGSADSPDAQPLERALGEHQVDYISRLGTVFADRLTERDRPLGPGQQPTTRAPSPKLKAIGLLGSSVDDELLLLQVLRPHFPDAVFFTDKLDARFLDQGASKFTRNLVVATSYGFELFQKLQVGAAPFRSSEQTGEFLAVQAAVGAQDANVHVLRDQLLPPLRYEIGRTRPMPLFVPGRTQIPPNTKDRFNDRLHPPFDLPRVATISFWNYHKYDILCCVLGAAFFGAMTVFVFIGRMHFNRDERHDIVAGVLILAGLLAIVPLFNLVYDGFEPLSWSEGVSIWPTEFFRLMASLTAVGSLYYCGSRVRQSRAELCTEFGLVPREALLTARRNLGGAIGNIVARLPLDERHYRLTEDEDGVAVGKLKEAGSSYTRAVGAAMAYRSAHPFAETQGVPPRYKSAQILWRYLGERSLPVRRYARAGMMTVFYIAGWVLLFKIIGIPVAPVRGMRSAICDDFVLAVTSILMVYLIFWVVDETQSCYRFVSRLGEDGESLWPEKAYERIPAVLRAAASQSPTTRKAASACIEVQFIGRLTQEAVPLIILPFVVLTLYIFARWTFFDNWHVSIPVLTFVGEDAAICVLCALLLKNAATQAKERGIRRVVLASVDARAAGAEDLADAYDALRNDMEANEEGAFQPWHQQPFVKAILLPFGGTGVMQAIEVMMSKP
jgi:hypothetical protein